MRYVISGVALALSLLITAIAAGAGTRQAKFFVGADISALPEMEGGGAVYRDVNGQPGDAIEILRWAGCNLFRVRLFVQPSKQHRGLGGPIQDLPYVIALARRIKQSGAGFLLDIHYSDTWADPTHQHMPASFEGLHGAALEQKVHDYTADVLRAMGAAGVMPDMVQVGNEITNGFLWPDGKLWSAKGEEEEEQWREFSRLVAAGCRAVREASTRAHPIRIVIHVDGGGTPRCRAFFEKLYATGAPDFDVIGLSFYPEWSSAIDALQQNIAALSVAYQKDVFIAETGYPWGAVRTPKDGIMSWPQTPAGQRAFLNDLTNVCRATQGGRCIGYAWWFPEAMRVGNNGTYRGGKEALFDSTGRLVPAAGVMRSALGLSPASQP
jgi:arabinogalactan endo-1,4-beta-galactosidase